MRADVVAAFSTRLFERGFRKELEKIVERMFKEIMKISENFQPVILDAVDTKTTTPIQYNVKLKSILKKWNKYLDKMSPVMVKRLQRKMLRYIDKKYNLYGLKFKIISRDLQQEMDAKAIETLELIKSIPQDIVKRITPIIMNSLQYGDRDTVYRAIRKVKGVSRRKAKNIARDQVAKNLEALNTGRARQVGLEYYYWDTQMDERVSKGKGGHKQLNGKIFKWDEPEAIIDGYGNKGHPKDRVNCRCRRRWVFPRAGQKFEKIKLGYKIVNESDGEEVKAPKDLGTSKKYQ